MSAGTALRRADDPAVTVEWLEGLLEEVGAAKVGRPGKRTWQCPAHAGQSPALRLRVGDRAAIVYCWAGCPTSRILGRLALHPEHLFRPPPGTPRRFRLARLSHLELPTMDVTGGNGRPKSRGFRFEAEHAFGDRWWAVRYRHPVTGEKAIEWECLNDRNERVLGLLGTPVSALPLYNENDIAAAVALDELVVVVESESSADALTRHGWHATTWAGGAATPQLDTLRRVLADHRRVLVIADADEPGRQCAARIAEALPLARVHVPDGDDGTDARDLLQAVGRDGFAELVDQAMTDYRKDAQ